MRDSSMLPDYHDFDEFKNRSRKLQEIKELNIEPYPHKFVPKDRAAALTKRFEQESVANSEEALEGKSPSASIAGRLMLFRAMGKNAFAQIQDDTGSFQLMFNRDCLEIEGYDPKALDIAQPPSPIKVIEKKFDLGDWIGLEGHLFRTQKGELTLLVKKAKLLCKSLLPLADKHSGLLDKELRYRKRWLDLISSKEVKDNFVLRARIMKILRNVLEEASFMEVETPVLQSLYGGANARPFVTEFHALDQQKMFLRISLEIALKKLLVGGFERVFEIGKVFRNESIDKNHNPEFSLLEAYAAYWDYNDMMVFVENLFEKIALELYGTTRIKLPGMDEKEEELDFKAPWIRLTVKQSVQKYAGIDPDEKSVEDLKKLLKGSIENKALESASKELLTFYLFEEKVEHLLIQPHHIIDHPVETTPLCKAHRSEKALVERFESFILGQEVCNAYSELNDPERQRELLIWQDRGGEEDQPVDEEFLEAICQGMPPAAGVGIGLDRLVMLFTKVSSIRDVLFFPFMKEQ